jgi:hypothetical protein
MDLSPFAFRFSNMAFARWLFWIAGIYGLVVLLPQYLLEQKVGIDYPPAITHPEYFYGFVGVGVAWQVAFLVIGQDPLRFRPMMIPSVLEKLSFAGAAVTLYAQGRLPSVLLAAGLCDLAFGVLFLVAWRQLGKKPGPLTAAA